MITRDFPPNETFGLVAQLRRAAVSIPSNVAEGNGRQTRGDYVRFLRVARGSSQELGTQLLIAVDLEYMTDRLSSRALLLNDEVGRMLSSMMRTLSRPVT